MCANDLKRPRVQRAHSLSPLPRCGKPEPQDLTTERERKRLPGLSSRSHHLASATELADPAALSGPALAAEGR